MIKKILPSTTKRVSNNTNKNVNLQIRNQTLSCLKKYVDSSDKVLSDRIKYLNFEWDIERILEANAASVVLISSILGLKKSQCIWFLVPGTIGFFLLQHALQGWCPPLPVLRKLGARTSLEIENEKIVLKMLRGDFMHKTSHVDEMLAIAEKQ